MLKSLLPSAHAARASSPSGWQTVFYQIVALLAVGLLLWFLVSNLLHNLAVRNIASGFGFLHDEAGFAIGESLIPYDASDNYGRAILVGLFNTVRVSVVAIVMATLLGTLVGLGRLSRNGLLRWLADAYVEVMRNTPLLLQLFFWYALITEGMPGPRQAWHPLPGVFVSNRGVKLPALQAEWSDGVLLGLGLAVLFVLAVWHYGRRHPVSGPVMRYRAVWLPVVFLALPLVGGWLTGVSFSLDMPQLKAFNFVGGLTISPEFTALLLGLILYTSAFVAEVVRAGVQSVPTGQWNAARALGLSSHAVLGRVILPQALRLIVPPMTSQYLNVMKNSSLAVAIGYPDLVSVANTTLNRTGQAVEGILIIMAAYLALSLGISLLMNMYNRHLALPGR